MLTKTDIRKKYKDMRSAMSKSEAVEMSRMAAEAFISSEMYKKASQIMLYIPLGNEADTSAITEAAVRDGKRLVLPTTDRDTCEITPVLWDGKSELFEGAFSVREPKKIQKADMTLTEVIIVPGIAFDRSGARVGFGKGCYDRLLNNTLAIKVGFCYNFQICDKIPSDEHDVKMDFLISEKGAQKCEK